MVNIYIFIYIYARIYNIHIYIHIYIFMLQENAFNITDSTKFQLPRVYFLNTLPFVGVV